GTLDGVSFTNTRNNFFSIHELPDTINHYTEYFAKLILGVDKQNNIWLAPNWKYLLKYNIAEDRYTKYDFLPEKAKKREGTHISSMLVRGDSLIFGTIDGLYFFNPATEKFSRLSIIPDSAFEKGTGIISLMRTSSGEIWFAIVENGLFRL